MSCNGQVLDLDVGAENLFNVAGSDVTEKYNPIETFLPKIELPDSPEDITTKVCCNNIMLRKEVHKQNFTKLIAHYKARLLVSFTSKLHSLLFKPNLDRRKIELRYDCTTFSEIF